MESIVILSALCGFTYGIQSPIQFEDDQPTAQDEFCTLVAKRCPYLTSSTSNPVSNDVDSVKLQMTFYPFRFLGISDKDQLFSMQGTFEMSWKLPSCASWLNVGQPDFTREDLLKETPEHGNDSIVQHFPKTCVFNARQMWIPYIEHVDRVGMESPFNRIREFNVAVSGEGRASYDVNGQFDSSCSLKFKKFPFDTQTCTIAVGVTLNRQVDDIRFLNPRIVIDPAEQTSPVFLETDIFHLINASARIGRSIGGNQGVIFSFVVKRKGDAYTGTIFLPMILLCLLQVSVFIMPAAISDRVGLSVTIFLSSSVLLGVLTSSLPETAETMYLVVNFGAQMAFSVLITVYSLIMGRLANDPKGFFSKTRIFRKKIALLDFIDLSTFVISLVGYVVINIIFFSLMMSDV